jgi:predicted ATP-binding protein involved in virulence
MIKVFKVQNLNKKYNFNFQFNDDLNIFTGKNGSGKTTLLKTMWYVLSGNIKHIMSELSFDSIHLKTNNKSVDLKSHRGLKAAMFNFSERTFFFPLLGALKAVF